MNTAPSPTPLNPLLLDTGSPPIPEARGWAAAYDGGQGPLIDLSQGAPGEAPPASLIAALATASALPSAARYGAIEGDAPLRKALAADVHRLGGHDLRPDDICITAGCNQAYFAVVMAIARAGDNIILPAPWYFNHEMTLRMLGIETRVLPCLAEQGFVPDLAQAEALIDARTRAIMLVTPNNPTGAVYTPASIAAFAAMAARRGIRLVLDETYRDFLPDGQTSAHDLFATSHWRKSVIGLYSFSKAYAVPGWRIGAILADSALIPEIAKVLDCIQISPVRAAQMALAPAVEETRGWREATRTRINARGAVFREAVEALPPVGNRRWQVMSSGAYFAYLAHPFEGVDAARIGQVLAEKHGVLMLPGPYFGPGQQRHLRVAMANVDEAAIRDAVERLAGLRV
ncbi:MAG: aminotransferase [Bosea sp. (in: a-proteobacteria)]